jgi:hypothetical protein
MKSSFLEGTNTKPHMAKAAYLRPEVANWDLNI